MEVPDPIAVLDPDRQIPMSLVADPVAGVDPVAAVVGRRKSKERDDSLDLPYPNGLAFRKILLTFLPLLQEVPKH